jgi:hypothetical protein
MIVIDQQSTEPTGARCRKSNSGASARDQEYFKTLIPRLETKDQPSLWWVAPDLTGLATQPQADGTDVMGRYHQMVPRSRTNTKRRKFQAGCLCRLPTFLFLICKKMIFLGGPHPAQVQIGEGTFLKSRAGRWRVRRYREIGCKAAGLGVGLGGPLPGS